MSVSEVMGVFNDIPAMFEGVDQYFYSLHNKPNSDRNEKDVVWFYELNDVFHKFLFFVIWINYSILCIIVI